jgi:protein TonB
VKPGIIMLGLPLVLATAIAQSQSPATATSSAPDASSEASAEHIYGPKDGVKPPKVTYSHDPEYPKKARGSGKEGTVVLSLVVGSNGLPREVKVLRSLSPDLDEAATDAVASWKFAPATKNGKPVAVRITVEIPIRLN